MTDHKAVHDQMLHVFAELWGHDYDAHDNMNQDVIQFRALMATAGLAVVKVGGSGDPADTEMDDLLMSAWGLLANVSEGRWTEQTEEWQEAVVRWRDQFHAHLGDAFHNQPAPEEGIES
jgi:hypothetical protein